MRLICFIIFLLFANTASAGQCSVSEALELEYISSAGQGPIARTDGYVITEWQHPTESEPTANQLKSIVAECSKEKTRDEKRSEIEFYAESLWHSDFPRLTYGSVLFSREIFRSIKGTSKALTPKMQDTVNKFQAAYVNASTLGNYTGFRSILAHDSTGWWP
jgi:hypothetical protein